MESVDHTVGTRTPIRSMRDPRLVSGGWVVAVGIRVRMSLDSIAALMIPSQPPLALTAPPCELLHLAAMSEWMASGAAQSLATRTMCIPTAAAGTAGRRRCIGRARSRSPLASGETPRAAAVAPALGPGAARACCRPCRVEMSVVHESAAVTAREEMFATMDSAMIACT